MNLLNKISSVESLRLAWAKLEKFNKESHGLTGETIAEFELNKEDKILSISKRLQEGTYQFSPYRAVLIPKSKGKFRPLQIPEVSDRVVIKAIAIELEEHFKELLEKSRGLSFAYQKGLGVKEAVEKMFAGTKVKSVNTMNLDGKTKRRGMTFGKTAKTKKAIVKLTADSKDIEIFQGM